MKHDNIISRATQTDVMYHCDKCDNGCHAVTLDSQIYLYARYKNLVNLIKKSVYILVY